ncbi:SF1B family DNA helicase RecD2 [Coraliomargarita akajimensis]|uniref:Helicase, RecD/TraA family n=1 Tax=Coraliomargarita akajimensis (strain DSM 45221 / IAM 15411 / JCM 23193 / KCTC 12865 / 04OKA010-24) TaxID=583355 RepID=D5EKM6_CORAD|nr:AAA family ATPase [Coraliomargarita akajimensis]ADE54933.1 helicase, RecD/TraA family [Coraliomargarita akajimensis DSM 45221]
MAEYSQQEQTLTGVLERIIFFNEENAYCVAEVSVSEGKQPITILGNLPGVQCGETLKLSGQWTRHATHGDQFRVANFKSELPASIHGIRKYLGSGMVKGIGRSYAKKIVDFFGADTLRVISEDSGRLHEVPGIGKARAKSIKAAWDEQSAVRDVMMFLQTYGVTPSQCVRLVQKYGSGARKILQNEPYRLAEDIERIGFKTADKLALNLGFPTNSKERVDAGILHTMQQLEDEGHTLGTQQAIIEHAIELLGVDAPLIQQRIGALVAREKLYSLNAYTEKQELLGPACQRPSLAGAEKRIAEALHRIEKTESAIPPIKVDAAVDWAAKKAGFQFADQQSAALKQALQSKVAIITGGPGTGKTTILRAIVDIVKAKRARIQLASPTGRAAQRLAEAAGAPASTIHRLLKYDGATRNFLYNAESPLPCDLLIVDEASMLDTRLAANLFDAIPSAAQLLLVGDADQLPSVGSGNVLGDLMAAPPAKVTRLDTIFRQGETSGIITTAHAILKGDPHPGYSLTSLRDLDAAKDFTFIEAEDADQTAKAITYLAREYIPKSHDIDPIKDLQVLSPMHRGTAGIAALNVTLQDSLNSSEKALSRLRSNPDYAPARQTHFREKTRKPLPAELPYGGSTFRIGDKVMQTRNNYDKGIFNGDTGIIVRIAADSTGLTVDFSGELIEFTKGELSEIQLAYAISIHKSQGSEYPVVIIPLLKQHFMMLQRNLVYTGITRARSKVYIVGSTDAYSMAVKNNKTEVRRTHLQTRLRNQDEGNTNHTT